MFKVHTEAVLDAPPELVWRVITDLDAYPAWNTFTPRITLATADLKVGAELDLDCQMTERTLLRGEREVILALEPERRRFCMGTSRRRGRPGIRSFRWQACEALADGRTRLVNAEEFQGPLAPLVYLRYGSKLRAAFGRYLRDLAGRVAAVK
ncbi:MAG: SRPBCC domain-containing protein [Spirochaetes bacterium]|nr:SRPBCC domain-containing protein [Spirochaetota bacterium]